MSCMASFSVYFLVAHEVQLMAMKIVMGSLPEKKTNLIQLNATNSSMQYTTMELIEAYNLAVAVLVLNSSVGLCYCVCPVMSLSYLCVVVYKSTFSEMKVEWETKVKQQLNWVSIFAIISNQQLCQIENFALDLAVKLVRGCELIQIDFSMCTENSYLSTATTVEYYTVLTEQVTKCCWFTLSQFGQYSVQDIYTCQMLIA